MDTHVVIMAGGIGSRLWPVSTPEKPKQFIDVLGIGKTLIQMTVERFLPVCNIGNFWVVTSEAYVDMVKEQLPLIPADHILAEPVARNTAPCIAYACWKIAAVNPNANVVVTPADALVINVEKFAALIRKALNFTNDTDKIVTVGIEPSRPDTGYGYICAEEKCPDEVFAQAMDNFDRAIAREDPWAFKEIVGIIGRFKSPGYPSVGIGFSDRTEEMIFPHQPDDLLSVHPDAHMK